MKIMITSFGVEHSLLSDREQETMFYRMPPVSFRRINEVFTPDYELLLLCDSIVMDETSFDRLVHGSVAAYSHVSETFQALRSEGRIELKDFASTLRPHKALLNHMIEHDLKLLDQWIDPLRDSLTIWRHFSLVAMDLMRTSKEEWFSQAPLRSEPWLSSRVITPHHYFNPHADEEALLIFDHHDFHAHADEGALLVQEALKSSTKRKRKVYRDALRALLRAYLAYVDANLILSHQLDLGFHDWLDFTPFYTAKFLSVGRSEDPAQAGREQLEKLFTIPFPDLAIRSHSALMKALNDKRIDDLRHLVAEAVKGHVQFDEAFAKSVLTEVFRSAERARKWRSMVGYATLPIGFIPWIGSFAQKVVEEGVAIPLERTFRQKHRWFYMLSDIAESTDAVE